MLAIALLLLRSGPRPAQKSFASQDTLTLCGITITFFSNIAKGPTLEKILCVGPFVFLERFIFKERMLYKREDGLGHLIALHPRAAARNIPGTHSLPKCLLHRPLHRVGLFV